MPRHAILHTFGKKHISATFASIFPDSSIAKSFKCEQLVDRIRDAPCYAVSFDECMNKISQNEQMAFIIRHTRTQNTGTPRISEHRQLKSHGNSLKSHGNSLKSHGKVMEKSWKSHGKVMEFYYQISVGTLILDMFNKVIDVCNIKCIDLHELDMLPMCPLN